MQEPPRSRLARAAAEEALVRIVYYYGSTPEFVVLGGLVPDLLCSTSDYIHVGTTDVDVQVNLEIQTGAVNGVKLEKALQQAGFTVQTDKSWRWMSAGPNRTVIKFELLADLDDQPAEADILFVDCKQLGAVNLRGTGFAATGFELRTFSAVVGGEQIDVEIRVAGLAGYLLAKIHAARSRNLAKDYYDIAFVLLNHDVGDVATAANMVRTTFPSEPAGATLTALDELANNFTTAVDQGPRAYADQMTLDNPDLQWDVLALDAISAVGTFVQMLKREAGS